MQQLADAVGTSTPTISRLETGKQQYTQGVLEALAKALGCQPADLISRDPGGEASFMDKFERGTPVQRQQLEAIMDAIWADDEDKNNRAEKQ